MERMILKKLLVISQSLSQSTEISFSTGLNIIVGGNKTGKSSLVKTIFDCFGCSTRMEPTWEKIITSATLFFSYGSNEYCIIKRDNIRDLFVCKDDKWIIIITTSEFSVFNSSLMKELGIIIPCVTKSGKSAIMPTSVLFALQYIDQDRGWTDIAKSFINITNTTKWKDIVRNFVSGFHDEEYFGLSAEVNQLKVEKTDKIATHEMNLAFYERIKIAANIKDDSSPNNPDENLDRAQEYMAEADQCQKQLIALESRVHELERSIFKTRNEMLLCSEQIDETKKDVSYAFSTGETLICPCCGRHYDNTLYQHLELGNDISTCENAIEQQDKNLKSWEHELTQTHNEIYSVRARYKQLQMEIHEKHENVSHEEYFKSQGRQELLAKGLIDLENLEKMISGIESDLRAKEKSLRKFSTRDRKAAINDKITNYCTQIADMIDYPSERVHIASFMQKVEETGSDLPKCIYMYYVAMYLYNLERGASPFNFLIVDTPNQQGQDHFSMDSILSTLVPLSNDKGQFILCTERETGYEDKASNVIELSKKRECLSSVNFQKHDDMVRSLIDIALERPVLVQAFID